ncbi:class I SAM-dependent methyltransferase [Streptomyces sp. NPDC005322]|uniref:class I SAM-dependent methyltransferase n=1 Tax=unclassified Streptomyces TaxID=2593676 RepID=UPI0033B4B29C
MSVSERYRQAWESYWRNTSDTPGEAIWDADPSLTAAPDVELLAPHVDPSLPIVDLGCGNGTQTRYLASRFDRALGVDLSSAAVEHARRADTEGVAEFQQLSLTDAAAVRELHERLGDVNVYMRAVIHQSDACDRRAVAEAVTELVGQRGRAFVVELTEETRKVLGELAAQGPDGPPPKLRRVFDHGLRPADAADTEMPEVLAAAGLEVLEEGPTALAQTERWADGSRVELPARWFVVRRVQGP